MTFNKNHEFGFEHDTKEDLDGTIVDFYGGDAEMTNSDNSASQDISSIVMAKSSTHELVGSSTAMHIEIWSY